MITFPAAVREAVRSVQCALLADNEYIVGSVGRFAGPLRNRALEGINATKALLGCDPSPTDNPLPPFSGGQCVSRYRVTMPTTNPTAVNGFGECLGTQSGTAFAEVWGPIGGLSQGAVACSGGSGQTATEWLLSCRGQAGSPPTAPTNLVVIGSAYTASIGSIEPLFGDSDNCGDPPIDFPPPTNVERDINITYNIDNGDEVTITVPFVFAPIEVDFNGNFRIPVTFDFGGNEFSVSFPLNPSIPITINFPGLNPGDDQGTDDLPPDGPGESVEPAPRDRKIIGVVVTATTIQEGRVSSYSLPQLPTIYVPRLGSIKFVYNLGGATFFSSDIDVKDRRTFVECPFPGGADAVIASPQVGVDFQFLPIRGFPLATTGDLPASS